MEISILTDEISLDIEEALAEGAALGFSKYEVRCIDSYEQRVPFFAVEREQRLQRAIEREGVTITALTPGVFKIDVTDTKALRKELEETLPQTCEMARRLSVPRVIVFAFMRGKRGTLDDVVARLREAGQIAQQFGLQLSVENEPGSYCDTGANTGAAARAIALGNVGVNWDPANAVVAGEVAYPLGYNAIKPYLQNVHIKDAIPIPPDKWENRLIGDGGMNWLGQLQALVNDKQVTHATLETHVFPVLEATREDLRRLRIILQTIERLNEENLFNAGS